MKRDNLIKKALFGLILVCISTAGIHAQNGPGGIGTSSENILWLRADQGTSTTTDGLEISYWNDISGNANNALQGDGGLQPLYFASGINSLPTIRFTGANNDHLSVPDNDNLDNTNGVSVFVIAQPFIPDDLPRGLVSKRTTSGNQEAFNLFTYTARNLYFSAEADRFNGSDAVNANAQIFSAVYDGTDANPRSRIYYNGNESGNGNGPTSIGNMTSDLHIGTLNPGYAQGFNGDISEVIVYRTALNNAERLILETYLSNRYGISLTATAYSSTTHTQDFVGIGYADGDKYSNTENLNSGILLSETNNTLDETNEFVFAGHDGTAHGTVVADLPVITGGSLVDRWQRIYYIERVQDGTVDNGNTDIRIGFDFTGTGITPSTDRVYYLLYRSGTSGTFSEVPGGTASVSDGKVWMNVSSANFNSGYYVIAKSDQELKTWYTINDGDWDDFNTWSLKANEPDNPSNETPGIMDVAVIQNNKTVTVTSAASCGVLNVIAGTVDFGTVTGNSFSTITGQTNGKIRLAADNFPSGNASGFADAATGGTVEYYGTGYDLSNSRTFRNMIVNLDNNTDQLILLSDYTLNGSLNIAKGELYFGNTVATASRNVTVYENMEVQTNGKIRTGSANSRHELNLYGNFTNYGDVQFTNRGAAVYNAEATDGIVDVNFLSATRDQDMTLEGPTRFYRIAIEKGISSTYELFIEATDAAYFELFGYADEGHGDVAQLAENNNSLGLAYGTVRVGNNIDIPRLNGGGNYNVSENAILWVDGGTVTKASGTGEAVVVYGKIKVSGGTFNSYARSGITTRLNGTLESTGGTTNLNQFRTSVFGTQHQGGYVQSGGTVNLVAGSLSTDYYRFTLTNTGNVFSMTGGTLHIQQTGGRGGIFINSDVINQNVTGGTVICEISNANDFIITSKAPFGSLELRKTVSNTNVFELDEGVDVGGSDEYLAAQPLVVLNDFTIGDGCFLDHNGQDITIGRNFTIDENSQRQSVGGNNNYGLHYNAADPNTLTFNGSQDGIFYQGYNVDDAYELYVWNLTVNKSGGTEILIQGNTNKEPPNTQEYFNRIINVQGTIDVQDGTLNQGRQSIRLYGPIKVSSTGELAVYEPGVTDLSAYIMLKDSDTELSVEGGAKLGNFKLNPQGANVVSLASDIYIKRIGYYVGVMNLNNHKLKVDYLHNRGTTNNYTFGVNATKMIYSDANASDGGIEIYIPANSSDSIFGIPLGTKADGVTRSTPAEIRIDSDTDDGYIQIRPVDGELKTTNLTGGNLLSYYWRVEHLGFTAQPTVRLRFRYNAHDDDASDEANFTQGKVLNENPYTRSVPAGWVNTANNTIGFDPVTIENANFTAGESGRFTGNVEIYYSRATNINDCNWNDGDSWTRNDLLDASYENHDSRQPAAGTYPQQGDVAVIGWCPWDDGNANIDPGDPHLIRLTTSIECAQLIFTPMEDISGNPRAREPRYASVFRPCLGVYNGRNLTTGLVEGEGMFWCKDSDPDFTLMDLGEFAVSDSSYVLYENYDASRTYLNMPSESPNLMISSDSWGRNDRTTIIATDIKTNGNFEIIGNANVELDTDADGDITIGGNLKIFEVPAPDAGFPSGGGGEIRFQNSGNARTITVSGDILLENENNSIYVQTPSANNIAHQMIVGGDITQTEIGNGLLFSTGIGNDHIDLTLNGDGNNSFNITAGSIPEFHRVIMNKGTDQTSSFTFNGDFTLSGAKDGNTEDKALYLQNGKLTLNDSDIDIDLSSGGEDFYIPSSSGLVVEAGEVNVSGADNGILLDGLLRADGANSIIDMDGGAGVDNYIEYSASGNAIIEIENNAQLTVGSQIRRGLLSAEGILKYAQTGGTVIVGKNAAPEGNRGTFEVINNGSEFTHIGGTLTVVNPQTAATVASVILEPSTSNVGNATLQLGNDDTPGGSTLTLKSKVELGNLTISGTNGPTAQLLDRSLVVNRDLTIGTGSTFDGTGSFNLTVNRHINNSGTADLNVDTLTLSGTSTFPSAAIQEITGDITVNHLLVEPETSVTLQAGSDLRVDGDLYLNRGQLVDGANTILVNGNVINNASHASSNPALGGIKFGGSALQRIYGTGQFGRIEIDNNSGVQLENSLSLTNDISLTNGILQLQSNKLTLGLNADIVGSGFDNTKMIAVGGGDFLKGIQKTIQTVPSAVPTDPYDESDAAYSYNFTFPIGVDNGTIQKYTPVDFHIASNSMQGTIELYPVNRKHITFDATQTDVLQYYWIINSSGLNDFTSLIHTHYLNSDVVGDESVYIGAKLYDNFWAKYEESAGIEVVYEGDDYAAYITSGENRVTGEYTAGIEPHIPDQVPIFYSKQDGDWTDADTWEREDGGLVPAGGPVGQRAHIRTAHTVTMGANYRRAYRTTINGRLEVGATQNHILGYVDGTGTLSVENSSLPSGDYTDFFACGTGGTMEWAGGTYGLPSSIGTPGNPSYNNLTITGTGTKTFPNDDITICGDLTIEGSATLKQPGVTSGYRYTAIEGDVYLKDNAVWDMSTKTWIWLRGDFEKENTALLNAAYSYQTFDIDGTEDQTFTGNFESPEWFNNIYLDNSNNIVFNGPASVRTFLYMYDGRVQTSSSSLFTVTRSGGNGLISYGDGLFEGPVSIYMKDPGTTNKFLPVGKNGIKKFISLDILASLGYWTGEYFNTSPTNHVPSLDHTSMNATLNTISQSEYWAITGPAGVSSPIELTLDGTSDVAAGVADINNLRIVYWNGSSWEIAGGGANVAGPITSGTISTTGNFTFDGSEQYFTIGTIETVEILTATITSIDESICENNSYDLDVTIVGNYPIFDLDYSIGATNYTETNIGTLDHTITLSVTDLSLGSNTITLNEIRDSDTPSNTGSIIGGSVTVTVYADHSTPYPTVTSGGNICGATTTTVELDGSDVGFTYELFLDATFFSSLAGTGGALTFTGIDQAGTYTVVAYNSSFSSCTADMNGFAEIEFGSAATAEITSLITPTICEGEAVELEITFTGTPPFTFTVKDNDSGTWADRVVVVGDLTAAGPDTYTYNFTIPDQYPAWTTPDLPNVFNYNVTAITDGAGCGAGTVVGTGVDVDVYKKPETGPQYHISNDWGN